MRSAQLNASPRGRAARCAQTMTDSVRAGLADPIATARREHLFATLGDPRNAVVKGDPEGAGTGAPEDLANELWATSMAHVAWQPLLQAVFPNVPALVPVAYLSRGGLQAWFALQTGKKQVRTRATTDLPYAWVAICVCASPQHAQQCGPQCCP
jgi:hypothetical protein